MNTDTITNAIKNIFVNITGNTITGIKNVLSSYAWAENTLEIHTDDGEVYLVTITRKNND